MSVRKAPSGLRTCHSELGGDRDFKVPIAGSEQMYVALRALRVPTELIIYPDQHHNISTPSHRKDRLDRYVAWYDKYVKKMTAVSTRL